MKAFVRASSIFLIFVTLTLKAQSLSSTLPPRELSKADYEKAKMLYLKMLDSPNWKKSDSISKFFASRYADAYKFVGNANNIPDFNSDSLYIPWIKENLHLTKFTSLDEVLVLRNEWKKVNVEVNKENLPLYDLMGKASTEQFRAIIQPSIDRNKPRFLRD